MPGGGQGVGGGPQVVEACTPGGPGGHECELVDRQVVGAMPQLAQGTRDVPLIEGLPSLEEFRGLGAAIPAREYAKDLLR